MQCIPGELASFLLRRLCPPLLQAQMLQCQLPIAPCYCCNAQIFIGLLEAPDEEPKLYIVIASGLLNQKAAYFDSEGALTPVFSNSEARHSKTRRAVRGAGLFKNKG